MSKVVFHQNSDKALEILIFGLKLYFGCTNNFTKLSAIVRLYNLKAGNGWSDKSFSELLKLLAEMLPQPNELPTSIYEVKNAMSSF